MARTLLIISALTCLSACGDPLRGVERLSETEIVLQEPTAAALPSAEEIGPSGSLLSRLLSRSAQPDAPAPVQEPAAEPAPLSETTPEPFASPEVKPARRGLFARLVGPSGPGAVREPRTSSLGPLEATTPRRSRKRTVDAADVPPGAVLPFGQIARVCDIPRAALGRKMETTPRRGSGFTLHDSAPETSTPRTWYITGFADGCPRQFTAALAVFGAPSMHEQLRYGLPAEEYPYSDTDKAYETIKSRICRVSRGKPCGKRIEAVERSTVFVSTYEKFEGSARWADILLHDGAVMAKVIKTP